MKENSIEEDILNIEKYIELVTEKNYCECNELNEICSGSQCYGSRNVAYSMKRILSDYKRLLKENEHLHKEINRRIKLKIENEKIVDTQFIYKQKIKDKIEEYKNMLKTCNKAKDIDRIKAINERILELQELIEEEK